MVTTGIINVDVYSKLLLAIVQNHHCLLKCSCCYWQRNFGYVYWLTIHKHKRDTVNPVSDRESVLKEKARLIKSGKKWTKHDHNLLKMRRQWNKTRSRLSSDSWSSTRTCITAQQCWRLNNDIWSTTKKLLKVCSLDV